MPWPTDRDEADAKFRPSPQSATRLASGMRLHVMNRLGLLGGITNEDAHEAILEAVYGARPAPEGAPGLSTSRA